MNKKTEKNKQVRRKGTMKASTSSLPTLFLTSTQISCISYCHHISVPSPDNSHTTHPYPPSLILQLHTLILFFPSLLCYLFPIRSAHFIFPFPSSPFLSLCLPFPLPLPLSFSLPSPLPPSPPLCYCIAGKILKLILMSMRRKQNFRRTFFSRPYFLPCLSSGW